MPTRDIYRRIPFDGLRDGDRIAPSEYRDYVHDGKPEQVPLTDVVDTAEEEFGIDTTQLYYEDPETGEKVQLPHWQATVNPAWGGGAHPDDRGAEKAVWDTPTQDYTPVGPDEWWNPLVDALDQRDISVFGQFRASRFGGVQSLDVFLADKDVAFDGQSDKILGVSTGHDYFGGTRLYANVIALDIQSDGDVAVMRDLTDPKKRKHTGNAAGEVASWWGGILDAVDDVSDTLYGVVTDALNYDMALQDKPCSVKEFYAHLGLPATTLAETATKRAVKVCQGGPGAWDAYHLHRAAVHALEHEYAGKDTRRFAQHMSNVNALLFNPARAERTVLEGVLEEMDEQQARLSNGDWDADGVDIEGTMEQREELVGRIESISEGVEEFESARDRLRTMLDDAEQDDADDDEEATSGTAQEASADD